MAKNTLFFLSGILLTILVFFSYNLYVKNIQVELVSSSFLRDIKDISTLLEKYKKNPDISKTQDALLKTYVASYNDPFTSYITKEESVMFNTIIGGDFEGIGAYIEDSPNGVFVQGTLPGSPAQVGGLLPGDVIQSINGQSTFSMSADEAVLLIRGPAGTPVVMDVFSTILSTKKDVTLFRKKLELPILTEELLDDVLVLHLLSFNDYSARDVNIAMEKNKGKYKKILLDLRDNGGGTLDAAVDVASLFISEGKIVSTIDGQEPKEYVSYGKNDIDIPVYILVNGQTASAAEILASALNFHLKSSILGSQTYGKGSVQELYSLRNGAQIKVTVAHWLTASGNTLDEKGITPDTIILPKIGDIIAGKDGQKEAAITIIKNT